MMIEDEEEEIPLTRLKWTSYVVLERLAPWTNFGPGKFGPLKDANFHKLAGDSKQI